MLQVSLNDSLTTVFLEMSSIPNRGLQDLENSVRLLDCALANSSGRTSFRPDLQRSVNFSRSSLGALNTSARGKFLKILILVSHLKIKK